MKKWLIIVNPNAGARQGAMDWDKIEKLLDKANFKSKVCFTERPGHAIEIVHKYADKGYRKIISVGGDGTLNEIVNGIYTYSTELADEFIVGVISVGTGNDWGRMFNIPKEYKKAIKVIKKEKTYLQDIGIVEFGKDGAAMKRYFVNVAGLGFDALVLKKANEDKLKGKVGKLLYFKNIFSNLLRYKHLEVDILVDDQHIHTKLFSMNVGICKYSGNGMMQVPTAVANDGLLDVTVMKQMTKFDVISNIRNLYDGSFVKHKKVELFRGKAVHVKGSEKLQLEVDGEFIGKGPFHFGILPRTLNIIVNK